MSIYHTMLIFSVAAIYFFPVKKATSFYCLLFCNNSVAVTRAFKYARNMILHSTRIIRTGDWSPLASSLMPRNCVPASC